MLLELLPCLREGEAFFIRDQFADGTIPLDAFEVAARINCWQMVLDDTAGEIDRGSTADARPSGTDAAGAVEALGPNDAADLFDVVNTVQPGFIRPMTSTMGQYFGIRCGVEGEGNGEGSKGGRLVAVAGERFRLPGLTELSAICTLPAHTGKGYAQRLIAALIDHNRRGGNEALLQPPKEATAASVAGEGGRDVFLHVVDSNVRAIRLYEKMGFRHRMDLPLVKLVVREGKGGQQCVAL